VFKGLLKHARDGEGFVLHNKGKKDKPELVLINATGEGGRDRCFTFPYAVFEEKVLSLLLEIDPRDVLPRREDEVSRADVLRARLADVRRDVAGLQEDLRAGYSKALAAVLREREAEEERVAQELQDELAHTVKPAERAWGELPSLAGVVENGGDEARLKLRPVLRRVVDEGRVLIVPRGSWRLVALQVFFTGGGVRDYLIVHQTAGNRRKGGSWARSLPGVVKPGALDLRKPADARRLAKALEEIDLAGLAG
jgi:hypothetical protein